MFPSDQFEWVLKLNTHLSLHYPCCRRHDDLGASRRGAINTASAAATEGQMGQAAYSAAKAGIVGMTLTIARDLSREGIRVNTIQPGIFDTPAMARATPEMKEALGKMVPFPPRMGVAEEYASMAMELARNAYVNGTTVRLDGAIRMQPR